MYEIAAFVIPEIDYDAWLTPFGLSVRIIFILALILIITGRKEYNQLKNENWRPWKDPRTN